MQKEACFFNKPCIILRTETEWVEILETGKAIITSASFNKITKAFMELNNQPNTEFPKIFGKGNSPELICKELLENYNSLFLLKNRNIMSMPDEFLTI